MGTGLGPSCAFAGSSEKKIGRRLWRLLSMFIVVAFAGVGILPESAFAVTAFSGSLNVTSPTMSGRITRDGISSTCAAVKSYPGDTLGNTFRYETTEYMNSGGARCVTFTYSGGTCGGNAFVSVYSGPFNPASRATNYLGDIGTSSLGATMAVFLTAGQTVTLVVNGTIEGFTCTFSVDVDVPTGTHDFNGDGRSDICWRDSNAGSVAVWFMNGGQTVFSGSIGGPPANWQIVGQRDFDGDRKHDLLWRDSATGTVAIWLLGGLFLQTGSLGAVPNDWTIVGTADFNGDGKGDILWRNTTTGSVAIWLVNGLQVTQTSSLGFVSSNWTIAGVGDFNGDGKPDILWRDSTTGTVAIWLLNGLQVLQSGSLGVVPGNWVIAGTGDFNGDGKSDIVWRDGSTGTVAIWLVNGLQVSQSGSLGAVPSAWAIAVTGDFDGDGKSDLLWRNTSNGAAAIWFLNALQVSSSASIGTVGLDWTIQGLTDRDRRRGAEQLGHRRNGRFQRRR